MIIFDLKVTSQDKVKYYGEISVLNRLIGGSGEIGKYLCLELESVHTANEKLIQNIIAFM